MPMGSYLIRTLEDTVFAASIYKLSIPYLELNCFDNNFLANTAHKLRKVSLMFRSSQNLHNRTQRAMSDCRLQWL